jgi:hypothetical protein
VKRVTRTALALLSIWACTEAPAQSLNDLFNRAKDEAKRAAEEAVRKQMPALPSVPGVPAAPGLPVTQGAGLPTPGVPPAEFMARLPSLTQKLAEGVRTVDFRNGIPPALKDRDLTPGSYMLLANPYMPADRRVMTDARAMACHPQGGVVVWAQMWRFDPSKEVGRQYVEGAIGAWRMEADGRTTPFMAKPQRVSRGKRLCDTPVDQWSMPEGQVRGLVVEPGGDVLLADEGHAAVMRLQRDGTVRRVAGGGPELCTGDPIFPGEVGGYVNGPGSQARFKGTIAIARGNDGSIFVAEGSNASSGNCSIRRIDPSGNVSTVFGNGRCEEDLQARRARAMTSVTIDRLAVDRGGQLLVVGVERGPYPGRGDGVFSKAFRIDPASGKSEMLAFASQATSSGTPTGRFDGAIGVAPDGTPVAYDDPSSSGPGSGLIVLDKPGPALRYWWKAGKGELIDGPGGSMNAVIDFCTASDGGVFFLQKDALRKLDPKSGVMTTWLQ